MPSLYEKLFGTPEEREKEVSGEESAARAQAASIVKAAGYGTMRRDIAALRKARSPRSRGADEDILYASGVRDGIEIVEEYLDSLDALVSNSTGDV